MQGVSADPDRRWRRLFSQNHKSVSKNVQQQCKGRVGIEMFVCMRNMTARQTTSTDCQNLLDFLNAGPLFVNPRSQKARQAPSTSGIVLSRLRSRSVASLVVVCLAAGIYFYRKDGKVGLPAVYCLAMYRR